MVESLNPLELPGWLEFSSWRTGLTPEPFGFASTPEGPEIRAVLYHDRRGRVRMPRGNPYLPVVFRSARQHPSGRTADWHRVSQPLVDEMRRRGSANQLYLSPDVDDVRPWQWRGFFVSVRYTYFLDAPLAAGDREVRRMTDKAAKLGITVERVTDPRPVLECLSESESRQGFAHGLGVRELAEARRLVGDDGFRMYASFDREGRPASAMVLLHSAGARAIGWAGGTKSDRLRDGASHAVWRTSFEDVVADGATGIDLCGANMPSVAAFKSNWGARLVTNYGVRTYSVRTGARIVADWLDARRM
jgi:hypothetical protein